MKFYNLQLSMMLGAILICILSKQLMMDEYHISSSNKTCYLTIGVADKQESCNQIELKMTLSKMEGTLLYMFDKYENQLIISLSDDHEERMKIEFRGEEHYSTLFELCGCVTCKYRLIELTVSIIDQLHIKCNNKPHKTFVYSNRKLLNKAYPIAISFENVQARLWLVNTPEHGHYNSNPFQLAGCIHEISVNGFPVEMEIYGAGISKKCPKACVNNVCNTGVCHESFDTAPFCDCTDSFLNGQFCNSIGIKKIDSNWKYRPNTFRSKLIKISWRANSDDIFGIWNNVSSVKLKADRNRLYLLYDDRIESLLVQKNITDKYQPNQNARLYLSFHANFIKIKFLQNYYTMITKSIVLKDLSKEDFTSFSVLSRPGFIDIVHKLRPSQYHWFSFYGKYLVQNDDLIISSNFNRSILGQNVTSGKNSSSNVTRFTYGMLSLLLGIIIVLTAILVVKLCRKRKDKKADASAPMPSNADDEPKYLKNPLISASAPMPSNADDEPKYLKNPLISAFDSLRSITLHRLSEAIMSWYSTNVSGDHT